MDFKNFRFQAFPFIGVRSRNSDVKESDSTFALANEQGETLCVQNYSKPFRCLKCGVSYLIVLKKYVP